MTETYVKLAMQSVATATGEVIIPELQVDVAQFRYTLAHRAGDFAYLSGIVARNRPPEPIPAAGSRANLRQLFR